MKTLFSLAFLAAPVAFVLAPLSLEAAGSVFSTIGLLALVAADYTRPVRSLQPRGSLEAFTATGGRAANLGLAA